MQKVTAKDFQRECGKYQDAAMSDAVAITHHRRERLILISAEEYHRLKARERQAVGIDEWTDEDIELLSASQVNSSYSHLNEKLEY